MASGRTHTGLCFVLLDLSFLSFVKAPTSSYTALVHQKVKGKLRYVEWSTRSRADHGFALTTVFFLRNTISPYSRESQEETRSKT